MKKLISLPFIGVFMVANTHALPDFDKLWDFNKPAETEKKFRELLPTIEVSHQKDYFLQLQTQISRTLGLQRKFDEAHKILDEVKKQITAQTPMAEIRYYLEKGRIFNSSTKTTHALPLFMKAFELASSRHQDNLTVDAAHMIAIAESNSEKQVEWNLKALDVAEKSKDAKARDWLGSLYNNMAWTYHNSAKYHEALDLFKKALIFRESKGDPTPIRIAKWCIARTYRSLKNYDEALKIQLTLEKELDKISEKDGYIFEELGEIYLALSKADLTRKYFSLAYTELSKDEWFKAKEVSRLQRIKEMSK